jgi:hypothetical protein
MSRRDEILARRARFVSAALVLALGCKGDKPNALAVPDAETKKATPAPEPKPPPKVAPPLNRPPVTAKVSVSGEAKRAAAAAKIEAIEKSIDELAGAIPAGCGLADTICRARFKAFADQLAKIREDIYALSPPACPPKLADDIAIQKMISQQHVWLSQWLDQVEKVGREQVRGDAGTAWQELYADAAKAYAHPCLEFACP